MSKLFWILMSLWLTASGLVRAERGVLVVRDSAGQEVGLYEQSHALLVGVSDYTAGWPDLESVPRELDRVERMLKARGFDTVRVQDPNAEQLERAFKDFIDAYGYRRGNRLLFFFAGHGHTWEQEGHGYLVPSDAPRPVTATGDPGPEFLRKALFMSDILAWSRQMTANHALFLFDSCFSGAVFKERALPPQPPHINRAMARPVREFITAGSAGEGVPARSVFTPAFVDALEYGEGDLNGDGYVTGMELGLHLEATVPRHARQSPQFGKHPEYRLSRGDFVFALGRSGTASPPPGPAAEVEVPPRQPAADPQAGEAALVLTPAQRRRVQAWLNVLDYDSGAPDGAFGPKTRGAIGVYQRAAGFASNGYLNAEVLARLQRDGKSTIAKLKPELIAVEGSCFQMGSPSSESGRKASERQHKVCVEDFRIAQHEVTVQAFRLFVAATGYKTDAEQGAGGKTGCRSFAQENGKDVWKWHSLTNWRKPYRNMNNQENFPVTCVSWNDSMAFIQWLNEMTDGSYHLPREAEWEYAARAGTTTARFWGNDPDQACAYANVADNTRLPGELTWKDRHNCYDQYAYASPVGSYRANPWGLHDILGNAWEFTCSAYDEDYQGAEIQCASRNQPGARSLRGGSWGDGPQDTRAAKRGWFQPTTRSDSVGFRLAAD